MSHLVNLASTNKQELVLDASHLTFFVDFMDDSKISSDKDRRYVTFHSTAYKPEHRHLTYDLEPWNLDADACQQKLSGAGYDFVKFPYIWGDEKNYGNAYINPDAVSAVITCKPFIPKNGTEPHVAALKIGRAHV